MLQTPGLQVFTIFTVKWKPCYGLLVRFPTVYFLSDYSSRSPILLLFAHYVPTAVAYFLLLMQSRSRWFSLPCTSYSLCLVCFSLIYFHGTHLFFRSQLKNTLSDIPHLIMPHRILTMSPDLLPSEHYSTLVI